MLIIVKKLRDLNFGALMDIYRESNQENAEAFYPDLSEGERLIRAEQDFYTYLEDCFFKTPGAQYAVWEQGGIYVSALRLEPYQDGLLLEALETAPRERRKGYAQALVEAVQSLLIRQGGERVYSHVNKRNAASLAVHKRCGFQIVLDYAVYADGSVMTNSYTLCWNGIA